jgi:hypothetical protein
VPGARQIELPGAQGFGASAAPPRPVSGTPTTQPGASAYRSISILSPAEQQTLWNIGGNLPVRVAFEPALQAGHRYDLILDGQRRNLNTANQQLVVAQVFRGTHTLQVVVIDSAGTEVMRSSTRNFVVQQASVQNPNSPLARPPGTNGGN